MKKKFIKPLALTAALAFGGASISGCAVLRSEEDNNPHNVQNLTTLMENLQQLPKGTDKQTVFQTLGVTDPHKLITMNKAEITTALYGNVTLEADFEDREKIQNFYASLEGYWFEVDTVTNDKRFGWSGTTNHYKGIKGRVPLVFKDGKLQNDVKLQGGQVDMMKKSGYLTGGKATGLIHRIIKP